MKAWRWATIALGSLVSACSGPKVADYAKEVPPLDIREYFNGNVHAQGLVLDRSGRVTRRFTVEMNCRWEGERGTLQEHFLYNDGERQERTWVLVHQPDGSFRGTAGDVVGEANAAQAGSAFRMNYTLAVVVKGKTWNLDFDDWMFRIDDRAVMNRAVFGKFGIRLGEVVVAFQHG